MIPRKFMLGAVIVCLIFALGAWRQIRRGIAAGSDRTELRLAHVTIHPAVIAMYDEAIRRYEELHPDVKIVQAPVPLKLWTSWQKTNLLGAIPPSIMAMDRGLSDEELARYFEPLDAWLEQPNPYNRGTVFENTPWRDTFRDGLTSIPAFRPSLQRVYGIPQTVSTIRVFANRALLVDVTGSDRVPETFDEFIALGEAVKAYAARTGQPLIMIAASETHCRHLMHRYFVAQTQRLAMGFDHLHRLSTDAQEAALAYLRGDWSWTDPAPQSGLELMRTLGGYTSPGFLQMEREEGIFYFNQQRALLLATGSWEADSVLRDCDFPVVIFPVPLPVAGDHGFGEYVLGPVSESGLSPGDTLGVPKGTGNVERAVDFLRFLTSRATAAMAMETSRRLSSVADLDTPPELAPFQPGSEGYPMGFTPDFLAFGGSFTNRYYRVQLHELFRPEGSASRFGRDLNPGFAASLRRDLNQVRRKNHDQQRLSDSLTLSEFLGSTDPDALSDQAWRLWEAQTVLELDRIRIDRALARDPQSP